ncbi:uncharacterized protein BO97DRAFT_405115 [Aspergillus homomorphus CBS 101889]|uniref:N-acetyltransferase domain-containing protein n=1 Tax=Aspergillus homomorphus (strain CBS 101889) TaxID=1450537 RepID=A0A395HYQ2_ASPHC|nr:hypothetical protein BO97DRAFT_405115 [Aspergillus homomorphus CBS 101889]RAL12827.1 hypothetical protein BO97DRAFT_405115 [Aspergillus homomorphus CBS 101889]
MRGPCYLDPIDLNHPDQLHELRRQRSLCGWDYHPNKLQEWRQKNSEGLKNLFWIVVTDVDHGRPITAEESSRAGHISLDAYCEPPDPDLARADRSVLAIQTFFILPEYRLAGLGRHVMYLAERLAAQEPNCRYVALTALSKKYMYQEGPDWRGIWERMGQPMPDFSIQEWYEKAGYVGWKEEPRYKELSLKGEVIWLHEVFMRKEIRREGEEDVRT